MLATRIQDFGLMEEGRFTVPSLHPLVGNQLKRLDVDAALKWVYCTEIPKKRREGIGIGGSLHPLARMIASGGIVVDCSSGPGGCGWFESEEPHEDAIAIDDAVRALGDELDPELLATTAGYLDDYSGFCLDERKYLVAAQRNLPAFVATQAMLGRAPLLPERPRPEPCRGPYGHVVTLRPENQPFRDLTGAKRKNIVQAATSGRNGAWKDGAYCPLLWDPSLEAMAGDRAEWMVWVLALEHMAATIGPLVSMALDPPGFLLMPWRA